MRKRSTDIDPGSKLHRLTGQTFETSGTKWTVGERDGSIRLFVTRDGEDQRQSWPIVIVEGYVQRSKGGAA